MGATAVEFTDVPKLKVALRIDTGQTIGKTVDDGLLRECADGANATIAKAIERNVLSATYTQTRNGTGTKRLMLPNYPVTAVASVTIVGPLPQPNVIPPPVSLTLGVDYAFDAYGLLMYFGVWPKRIQCVTVTYTAGYSSMPADLIRAATKLAAMRYREFERLGQKSKVIDQENITFDLDELPPDVKATVLRYQSGMLLLDELAGTL
jgi:hypothetical protein